MESHEKRGGYGDNDIGYVEIRKIFQVYEIRDFSHPDTVDAVSYRSCEKGRVRGVDYRVSPVFFFLQVEVRDVGDERNGEEFQGQTRNRCGKRDSRIGLVAQYEKIPKNPNLIRRELGLCVAL